MQNTQYGPLGFYINGEWIYRSDGPQLEVYDPATGDVLAPLPRATAEELDRAAAAANAAFPAWKALTALERENRELKRTNEIFKTASAYFAQAALDRRTK